MYYGETVRNSFARVKGKEHLKGMERRVEESVLIQHLKKEWHQSDFATRPVTQFKMSVTQCHDTTGQTNDRRDKDQHSPW